jgi:hypothetical protein
MVVSAHDPVPPDLCVCVRCGYARRHANALEDLGDKALLLARLAAACLIRAHPMLVSPVGGMELLPPPNRPRCRPLLLYPAQRAHGQRPQRVLGSHAAGSYV